jgi:hypothetical protein
MDYKRAAVTHEIGHILGLPHTDRASIMNPAKWNQYRTPTSFDKDNLARLYLHDKGGILPPGRTLIQNDTHQPEYVFNTDQWGDIHTLASVGADAVTGSSGDEYHYHAGNGGSPREFFDAARMEQRRKQRGGGHR